MKKYYLATTLSILFLIGIISCNEGAKNTTDEAAEAAVIEEVIESAEEASPLGNFAGLVGEWTVDAATAGVQMDLTFGEDGSFKQLMGEINQDGTWEIIDENHVKVVTPNTKGQTWLVTELTEESVNICWNPDKPEPKTIPMQRVK
ncbi:MAG: hypothetical protein K9J13_09640 [Saprospiraceae bacterium]|nr:hypothetical protein [Saprospiraceae bacterium]